MLDKALASVPCQGWWGFWKGGVPPAVVYVASIAIDRGISIISVPIVTAYLTPAEYGRLELAVSMVEFVNLVFLLGLADTALRFASTTSDLDERRRCSAELMGSALLFAVPLALIAQLSLSAVDEALGTKSLEVGLRWAMAGACASAFLDMPLAWMRMEERAGQYFAFIAFRAIAQLMLVVSVLMGGYGAPEMLVANGVIVLSTAFVLAGRQVTRYGIALTRQGIWRLGTYGAPLIIAGLAMFLLGSCNRWFLAGLVSNEEIAYLALAAKLSIAAALFMQPFMLWWKPRRLMVLYREGDGRQATREWTMGLLVLAVSITIVAASAPAFVSVGLRADYEGCLKYFPAILAAVFLNELCALCSIGSYARANGFSVMTINVAGAVGAGVGFLFLIKPYLVMGALSSVVLGHLIRLVLFLWVGVGSKMLRIPWGHAAILVAAAGSSILVAWHSYGNRIAIALHLMIFCGLIVFAYLEGFLASPRNLSASPSK